MRSTLVRRSRVRALLVLAVAGLASSIFGVPSAHADYVSASKDILASSNGSVLTDGWRDYLGTYSDLGVATPVWNEGSKSIRWTAFELLSHGDVNNNYFYIQVHLDNTLNRWDYPYRASPASLSITASGVTVLDKTYTASKSLGQACTKVVSVQLVKTMGIVSVSSGAASWTICKGGMKITASSITNGAKWAMDHLEFVKTAEFDFVIKVPATKKPNFTVALTTPYDYYNSYNAIVQTNSAETLSTKTGCVIGASGCPAV